MILSLLLQNQISGDAVIRGKTADSEIVITTTSRVAGAIHSLKWRGKEFIDSTDHGRQLQSAANFDAGSPITDETYNPTEAGSRRDGAGPNSSSRLLSISAEGNKLTTNSMMAFWLAPGENSGLNRAKNTTVLSALALTKTVLIGALGRPQLIQYNVAFGSRSQETHSKAVYESLTGYMPAEFSEFYRFDRKTSKLERISDGPGEQPDPIVFSTLKGDFAMGVVATSSAISLHESLGRAASANPEMGSYGRWRFRKEKVVKWNCVFRREGSSAWLETYFSHYLAVGTREQVRQELEMLHRTSR